jgi:hypothetical protein
MFQGWEHGRRLEVGVAGRADRSRAERREALPRPIAPTRSPHGEFRDEVGDDRPFLEVDRRYVAPKTKPRDHPRG